MRHAGSHVRGLLALALFGLTLSGLTLSGCSAPDPSASPTAAATTSAPGASYTGTPEEQLMSAVQAGDVAGVQELLDSGQSPDYWLGDATPLGRAIVAGDLQIVQALLDAGATIDNDEWSHTLVAAQYGDAEMVNLILSNGGSAQGGGEAAGWPLAAASYSGNVEAIHVLIAFGADPNALVSDQGGDFPTLVYAVNGGWLDAVKALVDAGADPHAAGSNGKTAIDAAKGYGHEEIADYLATVG